MTRPATPPATPPVPPPTILKARTPEDLLAAVPVVLGFEPQESVVMLTFGGEVTFHARLDLPPLDEVDRAVAQLLEPAVLHAVSRVVFIVYADDGQVPRRVVRTLRRAFDRAGIEVMEVLRAHDGRWFAPTQPEATPGGVPFDVSGHWFRAQAVVEGIVVHGSRGEVESLLREVPDAAAEVARAVRTADPSAPEEIADLIDLRLGSGRFTTAELARVLLGLREPGGSDAAWRSMTREGAQQHVGLWTDAVQRAPSGLVAAPAAVLALSAWLAGHGALAWCAVDRSRAAEPHGVLAGLVADLLYRAVPPSAWSQAAT